MTANSISENTILSQDLINEKYFDFLGAEGIFALGYKRSQYSGPLKQKLDHFAIIRELPGNLQFEAVFNNIREALAEAIDIARLITSRQEIISTQEVKSKERGFSWKRVPYGMVGPLKQNIDNRTAAVLAETIQVEGGVLVPNYGYLQGLRRLCDEQGAMLILDESQIGLGRTGYSLASEGEDVLPDLLITRLTSAHYQLEEVRDKGDYLLGQLQSFAKIYPTVVAKVRGRGLLVGIELTTEAVVGVVLTQLREYKILARRARNNLQVILLEPPLFISYAQMDYFIAALENSIKYTEKLL